MSGRLIKINGINGINLVEYSGLGNKYYGRRKRASFAKLRGGTARRREDSAGEFRYRIARTIFKPP